MGSDEWDPRMIRSATREIPKGQAKGIADHSDPLRIHPSRPETPRAIFTIAIPRRNPMKRLSLALVPLPAAAAVAAAQEKHSDTLLTVDHYLDFEQVGDPQISPDGRQIVYTRRYVNKIDDRWDSALWLMNADGSHNRMLGKGGSPVWSPDG